MNNPCSFIPREPKDFIGQTAKLAHLLWRKAETVKQTPQAVKMLVIGPPGTGKTAVMDMFASRLAGHSCQVESINGRNVTAEQVRAWHETACYRPLCGGYRVIIINELDLATACAQDLLLSLLDSMPPWFAVLATSNQNLSGLAERFQTRFQQFRVASPDSMTIAGFLHHFGLNGECANIAEKSKGNVRAALLDAQSVLDCKELEAA